MTLPSETVATIKEQFQTHPKMILNEPTTQHSQILSLIWEQNQGTT